MADHYHDFISFIWFWN